LFIHEQYILASHLCAWTTDLSQTFFFVWSTDFSQSFCFAWTICFSQSFLCMNNRF